MSGKSIISNAYLQDIGDAIREKRDTEQTYYPSQMADAIRNIEGIIPSGTLEITENGTYDVTQYVEVAVDIPMIPELWKTITLQDDHTSPNSGNPVYWKDFFEITDEDIFDGYIFLVHTSNNSGYINRKASYYMGDGVYFRDVLADGVPFVNAVFARTPFGNGASYRSDYYLFANVGTVFNIYRFKLS